MKRWLLRTLLLVALFGHLGHSFHDHHESVGGNSCKICIVDDHSVATHDDTSPYMAEVLANQYDRIPSSHYVYRFTTSYNSRAPPLS